MDGQAKWMQRFGWRLIAPMAVIFSLAATAAEQAVVVADFTAASAARWGKPPEKGRVTPTDGWNDQLAGVQVTFDDKGSYSLSDPDGLVTLGRYRWLSFWIKGDGRPHPIYLHIREGTASAWDQFYVLFTVEGDQWQPYVVDLTRLSYGQSPNHALLMRYTKSSKGDTPTDRQLTPGRNIISISFYSGEGNTTFSLSDIQAHVEYPALGAPIADAQPRTPSRPLQQPYRFAHTDGSRSVTLAEAGQSDFRIVIPADPTPTQVFAAQELQRYLEQSTGARLTILRSDQRDGGPTIFLGTQPQRWGLTRGHYQGANRDGFALTALDEKTLVITGGSDRGVLFGVYDFLEKAAGVRFLRPIAFGEVVPQHDRLVLPLFQDQEEPVFTYRRNHYCSNTRLVSNQRRYEVADWSVKVRYNVELERLVRNRYSDPEQERRDHAQRDAFYAQRGGVIPLTPQWTGHNFHRLVPTTLFEEHPEYFPLEAATGKRRAERAQLCVTNPDVAALIARKAAAYFREHPDEDMLWVCQEDGSRLWCQCPNCLALNPTGSPSEQHMADQNIYLANAVARLLEDEFPDKIIATYAYNVTRRPPAHVKPHPNVTVVYCGFEQHHQPGTPAPAQVEELERWSELIKPGVIIYDYLYANHVYQYIHDDWLAENNRFYADHGVRGVIHETGEGWGLNDFKMYAAPRLAWNPWLDIEVLREDYYRSLYGPAAEAMARFDAHCQLVFFDEGRRVSIGYRIWPMLTDEDLAILADCIAQAYRLTGDDVYHARIGFKAKALQYIQRFNSALRAIQAFEKHKTPLEAQRAQDAVDELRRFIEAHWRLEVMSSYDLRFVDKLDSYIQRGREDMQAMAQLQEGNATLVELPYDGWRFQLDPHNRGEQGQWFAVDFDDSAWAGVRTGEFWEKQGYDYDGVAWYRRWVEVPSDLAGQRIELVFLGVDERAWVYVDGRLVGSHAEGDPGELWVEPFSFDVTEHLKPGQTHQITVRVHDSGGAGGIWKPVYLRGQ